MLVDVQNDGLVLMVDIEPWGQTALCEVPPDRLVSERQNNFILAYLLYILGQSVKIVSAHDQEQEKSFKS